MFYWLAIKPDSLSLLQCKGAEQTVVLAPYPHAFPPVGADVDYFRLHHFPNSNSDIDGYLGFLFLFVRPWPSTMECFLRDR